MTRDEEIRKAAGNVAIRDNKGHYAHGFLMQALREAFTEGARWADSHPHWISVEDELPEVGVAVLTTTQNGTQRVGFYEDGWWLANSPDLVRMGSITHWMRIEPPEHIAACPDCFVAQYPPCGKGIPCCKCHEEDCNSRQLCPKKGGKQ